MLAREITTIKQYRMESLRLPPHHFNVLKEYNTVPTIFNNLTFIATSIYPRSSITYPPTEKGQESGKISWSWSFYYMSGCIKSHTIPLINLIV